MVFPSISMYHSLKVYWNTCLKYFLFNDINKNSKGKWVSKLSTVTNQLFLFTVFLSSFFPYMCIQGQLLIGPAGHLDHMWHIWHCTVTTHLPSPFITCLTFPGLFPEAKCLWLPCGPLFPYLVGDWQPTSSSLFRALLSPDKAVHSHTKGNVFFWVSEVWGVVTPFS